MPVFTAIGSAIFGAGTFLAGLTAAGLQVVTGIAFSAIGKAMQGEPQPAKFGVQVQLQGGDDVPRSINFGWNCTAGSLVYHSPWAAGGVMSTHVMAIGDIPIRELVGVEIDGVPDTLLKGEAHPQYGWPVAGFRKDGRDHLWIKFYDGTQTAADSFLTTYVSSPSRPYGADRIGYGVPYAIVTAMAPERNDDGSKPLFQGKPAVKFITYGARWYDPSRDSTVGGVGAQRWNNPATWGGDGDFLPPVHIYNVLRGIRFNGQWLYGLQAMHPARIDDATFIAAINRARALVDGPSGPEATFRAGGELQVGAQVNVSIEAFLTACNGRLVEVGGTYKLYVGEPGAPVMAFTDGDILSTEEQTFSPFLSLADTVNGVAASYPNPAEGWNVKTAPPLLRPDLEALDGNRRLMASVSLDVVPYKGQVQRLMKWALSEALRARRHTFVLGPEFRVIEPGDVVRWTSARNGYVDKLFRVDGVIYKANLDVIVDLTEVDPSDYDWDQDEDFRPVTDGVLNLAGPIPMPMSGWEVLPARINDDQGRPRRPSIQVRYASGLAAVNAVRVQVRVFGETVPMFDSDSQPYGDPWRNVLTGTFTADTLYEVRGILLGPARPLWSNQTMDVDGNVVDGPWLQVRTEDIKLGPLDVVYGDLNLDELGQQAKGLLEWIGGNIRDLIDQAQAQAMLTGDQELANAVQFDEMRRSLSTVAGNLSASFEETITTAIIPMNGQLVAVADALTQLSAADGDDLNTARWRMTATSGPSGSSTIGIETRFNPADSDDFRMAGSYWVTPNNPDDPTRRIEIADQFIIASSLEDITFQPFVFEDGEAKMMAARIDRITAGLLEGPATTINLTTGFFSFGAP